MDHLEVNDNQARPNLALTALLEGSAWWPCYLTDTCLTKLEAALSWTFTAALVDSGGPNSQIVLV